MRKGYEQPRIMNRNPLEGSLKISCLEPSGKVRTPERNLGYAQILRRDSVAGTRGEQPRRRLFDLTASRRFWTGGVGPKRRLYRRACLCRENGLKNEAPIEAMLGHVQSQRRERRPMIDRFV